MNMDDTPPPHFIRIIDPDILRAGKLQLPTEFVRKYGRRALSGPKVLLVVPTGDTWSVTLAKSGRIVFLHGHGWQNFVRHYSVAVGSLLLFRWCRQSVFEVAIFDISSNEIDYLPTPYAETSPEEGITSQEDSDSEEEEDDDTFANTAVCGTSANPIVVGFDAADKHFRNLPSTSSSKPKFNVRVNKNQRPSSRSFQLKIRRSYLERKSRVTIPGKFVKANRLNELDTPVDVWIRRLGSTEKWRMQYIYRESEKRGEFSNAGWHTFHREAGLEIGDKCEFELTEKKVGELVFAMSVIYRPRK